MIQDVKGKGQPKLGWLLMDHPLLSACRSWILVTVRSEAVVLRVVGQVSEGRACICCMDELVFI